MAGTNGSAPRPETMMSEVGVSGNTGYWGTAKTGEYVTKLDGAAGRIIWDRMRRSDHQVQAVLAAITLPILQAGYYVEPASKSAKDRKVALILEDAFLKGMTITWADTLRHALLMLPFGFSALEKVYEYRDGLVLPRKLDPRLPQSVSRWDFDTKAKRLRSMVQQDTDGRELPVPIEKLLVFTTDKEGDNWEGRSILRPAYKAWYIKDDLEKTNALGHARWGVGVPRAKAPQTVERGSPEWEAAKQALEDIHANEKAYFMQPFGWDFDILGGQGKGQGTDVLSSIKYYDECIAKAMLAMHINLGTSQTGSKALGQSFMDAFLMATQAWADYIAEVIDRFCLRQIVDYNWKVKKYPTFKARRILGLDFQTIGFLVQSGVIEHDDELENSLRSILRLPEKAEPEPEEPPPEAPVPPMPPEEPMMPSEGETAEEQEAE